MTTIDKLQHWLDRPSLDTFPYAEVVRAIRTVGKHFVDPGLLTALAGLRAALPEGFDPVRRFLDTALDKYDGRYDNPSYLALHDLPLPAPSPCPVHTEAAEAQRDRLTMLLVADLLRFEIAAHDGTADLLPQMRPDARIVAKRCTLGLLALRPAMERQGLDITSGASDAIDIARELCTRVEAVQTPEETRMLAVTLLTVSSVHDENLFVRVLQSYETAFALAVVELRAAIVGLMSGEAGLAARALRAAEQAMREVSPLFSLVATMRPEAFMTFREYTDGASAVQSRNYKTIESLCSRPSMQRLMGPGYDAVPEVRERVFAGQPTIEDALAAARLDAEQSTLVAGAMDAFEAAVMDWRKMHHNLALRMLGMRRGTGYTEGVPYLAEAKTIPLFGCPYAHKAAA